MLVAVFSNGAVRNPLGAGSFVSFVSDLEKQ